jgi:hypothetical protein
LALAFQESLTIVASPFFDDENNSTTNDQHRTNNQVKVWNSKAGKFASEGRDYDI